MLGAHQGGRALELTNLQSLYDLLQSLGQKPLAVPAAQALPAVAPAQCTEAAAPKRRQVQLSLGQAADVALVAQLSGLLEQLAEQELVQQQWNAEGMAQFTLTTSARDDELRELLAFHVAPQGVQIAELAGVAASASASTSGDNDADDFGLFDDAPGLPVAAVSNAAAAAEAVASVAHEAGRQTESTSIRVGVAKVDQLINLVGELVITQATLAQQGRDLETTNAGALQAALADLERNTRGLQEAVMSIRMIAVATVFSRFPRMVRDLAARLGKQVELSTHGEATELDKGLVEKIIDPLTHLIRNAIDHGIETPAQREAAGKPPAGQLTLSAAHQGGSIVIEVRDDGGGLSREKILAKALGLGWTVDPEMPEAQLWQLVFEPGFTTADALTDVSGRGVGMDVVRRNIAALGGSVDIDSVAGVGTRVQVRLPLTLAIMDGMSVSVGSEVYLLPLASVVESLQLATQEVHAVANGTQLVKVRDEYLPVLHLDKLFAVPRSNASRERDILVVIESDGGRVALHVEALVGQQQVVVKNLEANYRKVPNVSGVTILGNGAVALILDTAALVRQTRQLPSGTALGLPH